MGLLVTTTVLIAILLSSTAANQECITIDGFYTTIGGKCMEELIPQSLSVLDCAIQVYSTGNLEGFQYEPLTKQCSLFANCSVDTFAENVCIYNRKSDHCRIPDYVTMTNYHDKSQYCQGKLGELCQLSCAPRTVNDIKKTKDQALAKCGIHGWPLVHENGQYCYNYTDRYEPLEEKVCSGDVIAAFSHRTVSECAKRCDTNGTTCEAFGVHPNKAQASCVLYNKLNCVSGLSNEPNRYFIKPGFNYTHDCIPVEGYSDMRVKCLPAPKDQATTNRLLTVKVSIEDCLNNDYYSFMQYHDGYCRRFENVACVTADDDRYPQTCLYHKNMNHCQINQNDPTKMYKYRPNQRHKTCMGEIHERCLVNCGTTAELNIIPSHLMGDALLECGKNDWLDTSYNSGTNICFSDDRYLPLKGNTCEGNDTRYLDIVATPTVEQCALSCEGIPECVGFKFIHDMTEIRKNKGRVCILFLGSFQCARGPASNSVHHYTKKTYQPDEDCISVNGYHRPVAGQCQGRGDIINHYPLKNCLTWNSKDFVQWGPSGCKAFRECILQPNSKASGDCAYRKRSDFCSTGNGTGVILTNNGKNCSGEIGETCAVGCEVGVRNIAGASSSVKCNENGDWIVADSSANKEIAYNHLDLCFTGVNYESFREGLECIGGNIVQKFHNDETPTVASCASKCNELFHCSGFTFVYDRASASSAYPDENTACFLITGECKTRFVTARSFRYFRKTHNIITTTTISTAEVSSKSTWTWILALLIAVGVFILAVILGVVGTLMWWRKRAVKMKTPPPSAGQLVIDFPSRPQSIIYPTPVAYANDIDVEEGDVGLNRISTLMSNRTYETIEPNREADIIGYETPDFEVPGTSTDEVSQGRSDEDKNSSSSEDIAGNSGISAMRTFSKRKQKK